MENLVYIRGQDKVEQSKTYGDIQQKETMLIDVKYLIFPNKNTTRKSLGKREKSKWVSHQGGFS